jgi:glyoxylase-like metal-dependent hydrolase (beta-lactamase superfamily II)
MLRLTENVMVLGNGNFNYFVVGQKEGILIECGTSAGVSIFAQQWSELQNKPDIKYILVMHSHFDHACGLPMLKDLFPAAQAVASQATQKILSLDKLKPVLQRADVFVTEAYAKEQLLLAIPGPLPM